MPQFDDYETLNFILVRVGIDKILDSVGKSTLKEIKEILATYFHDINHCYLRPDVLCMVLKIIYGKPYIEMIKPI